MSVLLFDLFGVIARHQSSTGLAELERLAEVPARRLWAAYWALRQPYDRGDETGPEYWRRIAAELGVRYSRRRVGELVAADVHSWREVDPEMVELVRELAARGERLGLLSNIPVELADDYERRYDWLGVFSVRAFSCRIRHAKPEPGAYAWCVERLGVPAEQVLFIDDREQNVAGARAAGLRGHRFTSAAELRGLLARPRG
jgi:putative hydrolase of the HAD superfamily